MLFKMAIIGHGFVGQAVDYGFQHQQIMKTIVDPRYGTTVADIDQDTSLIFIAVPTPMHDFSIFRNVMDDLKDRKMFGRAIVVVKSTVPPNVLSEYADTGVIYNPEFLTEKDANRDFVNPPMHVFGGDKGNADLLESYYNEYSLCKTAPVYKVTIEEASIIKYSINSFLATKVMFFNQVFEVCQENGFDYDKIAQAVGTDPRITPSHTMVPGHDGKRGFGGACFPKDTAAILTYSKKFTVIQAAVDANNKVRSTYELDDREKVQGVIYKTK